MEQGYWFKSSLFEIHKDEDQETNSGCYGKELGACDAGIRHQIRGIFGK